MSDQPGRENFDTDLTSYSVDDEDQLQPEDTLDGTVDPLDRGYTAPDRLHGSVAFGVTAEEQAREETIDQRIMQEESDPDSAYGAPDNESGLDGPQEEWLGGDDPDAIRAEDDFVGTRGGGTRGGRVGRLVAPDQGNGPDTESEAWAREGKAMSEGTAEEAAMHYVDGDDVDFDQDDGYLED